MFLEIKFENFSINASNTSAPSVQLALLPVEASRGTGYPPIKFSVHCQDHLWIARQIGAVEAFSLKDRKLTDIVVFPFPEDRTLVGLFVKSDDSLLAVSDKGDLATWSLNQLTPHIQTLPEVTDVCAVCKKDDLLAVGGKGSKNNLKVFNLNDLSKPLYTAKPTINTRLNDPFKVDIRSICFTSSARSDLLAISNSDGQVFLYDFSLQSKALLYHQVLPKKSVINSISRADRDEVVIYSDVTGVIESFDLRAGRSYGRFKPQEGAVQASLLTSNDLLLLTASKDRYLRIFSFPTRTLLHKFYLKHVPTTISVVHQDWLKAHAQEYEDSEDEQVWESMTIVSDKNKKNNKLAKLTEE